MTRYDIIKHAIENKQLVIAIYQGRQRELCPHILGYKKGRMRLFAYQFSGESKSGLSYPAGSMRNWRCMFVDELENVRTRSGKWYTPPNYSSSTQHCIDEIDVEVY